jgi:hypothetical protein
MFSEGFLLSTLIAVPNYLSKILWLICLHLLPITLAFSTRVYDSHQCISLYNISNGPAKLDLHWSENLLKLIILMYFRKPHSFYCLPGWPWSILSSASLYQCCTHQLDILSWALSISSFYHPVSVLSFMAFSWTVIPLSLFLSAVVLFSHFEEEPPYMWHAYLTCSLSSLLSKGCIAECRWSGTSGKVLGP